jgi:uncharacterized integral membrane protein
MIANGSENVLCCGRVIFAVVALFHLVRIYMDWPVMIGDWSVPMWVSWIGLVVAGGLAFFRVETCRARCTLKRVWPPQLGASRRS